MRKLLLVGFTLALISCGKSFLAPENGSDIVARNPVLSRILVNGQTSTEFSYDEKYRLVKTVIFTSPGSGISASETVNRYDTDGKLIKVETAVNVSSSSTNPQYSQSYSELVYDAGNSWKETKTYNMVSGTPQYASRAVPEYNNNGRLISLTLYPPNSQTAVSKNVYQYNAEGNVASEQLFQYNAGLSGPSSEKFYEYDVKKNPLVGTWVMPYGANFNNITKITANNYLTAPGMPANNPTVTTINFKTYNSLGYPLLVQENGVDYTYEYK